jgi:hypothetical protein
LHKDIVKAQLELDKKVASTEPVLPWAGGILNKNDSPGHPIGAGAAEGLGKIGLD